MRCEKARKWMSLALDELLTGRQREELEQHLRQCVGCRAEQQLLRTVQRVLTTTKPVPLPYDTVPMVIERVKALEREQVSGFGAAIRYSPFAIRSVCRWLAAAAMPILLAVAIIGARKWQAPTAPSESFYMSAHATSAAAAGVSPELTPISLVLSGIQFAGDER